MEKVFVWYNHFFWYSCDMPKYFIFWQGKQNSIHRFMFDCSLCKANFLLTSLFVAFVPGCTKLSTVLNILCLKIPGTYSHLWFPEISQYKTELLFSILSFLSYRDEVLEFISWFNSFVFFLSLCDIVCRCNWTVYSLDTQKYVLWYFYHPLHIQYLL